MRSFFIDGPVGRLEALLNEGKAETRYSALICHPHPLGGGTMHNKVVYHAMKAINAPDHGLGWPVLRFNYRGTGLSDGSHHGSDEWQDVAAALDWLGSEFHLPVIAAGFSFGAAMTLKACCSHGAGSGFVRGIVALGLPTESSGRHYNYDSIRSCTIPKLFLSGDRDEFAPIDELRRVTDAATEPKTQALIAGANHFFTGQLVAMQGTLSNWLSERYP